MKSMSLFSRFFIAFLVCTFGFLSIAAYAAEKAYETDPNILNKIEDKFKTGISIAGMSAKNDSYEFTKADDAKDSWTLQSPSTKINFKSYSGDLEIKTTPGKEVIISATGFLNKNKSPRLLVVDASTSEIDIKQPDKDAVHNLKVQIQIPESYNKDLDIKTVSGDLLIENAKLTAIDLKSVSGNTTLHGVQASSLDIKTVSGDIKVKDSSIPKINGKGVSGDLELSSNTPTSIDWRLVSGNVKLKLPETKDTHFALKSTSGNIENKHGSTKEAKFEINILTVNGNIDIE